MLRLLPLIILTIFCTSGNAQVAGYLGKKITLQTAFESFPCLGGPTANNKGPNHFGDSGGGFGFNWRAEASLGYVITRKHQLFLSADYFKTGMLLDASYTYDNPFFGNEITYYNLFYNLTGKTFGAGVRFFKIPKGAIAPLGHYESISLHATFLTGAIRNQTIDPAPPQGFPVTALGINPTFKYYSLAYEFGQNFIIRDFLVLNFSGRIHIPLQLGKIYKILADDGSTEFSPQQKFENAVLSRMATHSFLMINVGVGVVF
jgi:hypothetical protein